MNYPSRAIVIALFLLVMTTLVSSMNAGNLTRNMNTPILIVNPSSIVLKVGDSANVNVTLTNIPASFDRVCFGVEDFPTSGFVTTIVPLCADAGMIRAIVAILSVEATPAAAPQSFTAYVVATSGNWTDRTTIGITVVPAMSAWIPWSIVIVFILILVIPLIMKRKPREL